MKPNDYIKRKEIDGNPDQGLTICDTTVDLNKCLEQFKWSISLHLCTSYSKLPSNINTIMPEVLFCNVEENDTIYFLLKILSK